MNTATDPAVSFAGGRPSFFNVGGAMAGDARSYVSREADLELFDALRAGQFCYVLTGRQMGKSSLMVRTAARLRETKAGVAMLDLTAFGQNVTPEQWFNAMRERLGRQLDLEDEVEAWWDAHPDLSPLTRWMGVVTEAALPRYPAGLVIFIDEIDYTRSLPFNADELFAAIRECCNRRTTQESLKGLTFCLMGVATPTDLIRDTRTTPFNIGRRIELTDFSPGEAAPLAQGLRSDPALAARLLGRVLYWTGGHPYLTQRLCQAVAEDVSVCSTGGVDRLCQELFLATGARETDHNLVFVRERVLRSELDIAALLNLYAQVLGGRRVEYREANPFASLLRLAGIVKLRDGVLCQRNRIYAQVFDRGWVRDNLPDQEVRRQKAAFRRGVLIVGSVSLLVASTLAVLTGWALHLRNDAEQHRKAAEQHRDTVQRQHSQLLAEREQQRISYAADAALRNSLGEALLWTSEALRLNPKSELSRRRAGCVARQLSVFELYVSHGSAMTDADMSLDGKRFITCGRDNRAQVWDAQTGQSVGSRMVHEKEIHCGRFSPDGQRVVTASEDCTARIWDALTGLPVVGPLRHDEPVIHACFSPDNARVLCVSQGGEVRIWDARSGKRLPGPPDHIRYRDDGVEERSLVRYGAFSPDGGKVLTCSSDRTARIWDSTGKTFELRHQESVLFGEFSPDGRKVVTASRDNTARIWDADTGQPLSPPLAHEGSVLQARFRPDGAYVLTTSLDYTARLWSVATGKQVGLSMRHASGVPWAQFSRDGTRMVTASWDRFVRVWGAAQSDQTRLIGFPLPHTASLLRAALSPEGDKVLTASVDGTVRIWPISQAKHALALPHPGAVWIAEFSPDSQTIVTAGRDGLVQLWRRDTGAAVLDPPIQQSRVVMASFSPDSRKLLTACEEQGARIWDARTGEPVSPPMDHVVADPGDPSRIRRAKIAHVAFSNDGRRVATCAEDGLAQIWDAATGRPLFENGLRHPKLVWSVEFSPDDRLLLTTCDDRNVRLWDTASGKPFGNSMNHPTEGALAAAFSPNGRLIVSIGRDRFVRLWHTATGIPAAQLDHDFIVWNAEFSPDGTRLVTAAQDGTARIWNTETGRQILATFGENEPLWQASFSPDGQMIVTACEDGTARLWDATTGSAMGPPLAHVAGVTRATFSADGRSVVTACGTAQVFDISPIDWPAEDIDLLGQVMWGHKHDRNRPELETIPRLRKLRPEELSDVLASLKVRRPGLFGLPAAATRPATTRTSTEASAGR